MFDRKSTPTDGSIEVKTYEQALSFLNVSEDFADDAVVAMFTTKVCFLLI